MNKFINIGKIIAPHGVRGEFRIKPLTENPDQFLDLKEVLLNNGRKLTVTKARFHKNIILMKCEEINTPEEVDLLRGVMIRINSADLPELPKDNFYVADLIGFDVYDEENNYIGKLKDVIVTGGTDVFVISGDAKDDVLIPALKSNIPNIDIQNKKIDIISPKWAE